MMGSPELAALLWPVDSRAAALAAAAATLARSSGGGSQGYAEHSVAGGGGAYRPRVEIDSVEVGWHELGRALPSLGPAVLRVTEPSVGHLVLLGRHLGRHGRRLVALTPEGRHLRIVTARLAAVLAEAAWAPHAARVDSLLAVLALTPGRWRRARRALLVAQLAGGPGLAVEVLSLRGDRPVAAQLRAAGLAIPFAVLLAALGTWQALALGSWYLLGRGVLDGGIAPSWLLAWALILATLVLVHGAELAAADALGRRATLCLRRRVFAGFLAMGLDRLQGEGTGRLLGRLLGAEALERLWLSAGPSALVAVGELTAAGAVLAHGAAALAQLVLMALAVATAAVLVAGHLRAHRACAEARFEMTDRLVEALAGHRTRLVSWRAWRSIPASDWSSRVHRGLVRVRAVSIIDGRGVSADQDQRWTGGGVHQIA